ncbi:unnamed protein product [Heligmosomoides polygyrus]|uniref:Uncharacterized protein n=1 Tax=Heligmosomoides polygyrus TaxID=6339 RepID=A0A183FIT2_HELPZ|nr:unnamed protein product [Heligmosomoides polygyrus]
MKTIAPGSSTRAPAMAGAAACIIIDRHGGVYGAKGDLHNNWRSDRRLQRGQGAVNNADKERSTTRTGSRSIDDVDGSGSLDDDGKHFKSLINLCNLDGHGAS